MALVTGTLAIVVDRLHGAEPWQSATRSNASNDCHGDLVDDCNPCVWGVLLRVVDFSLMRAK